MRIVHVVVGLIVSVACGGTLADTTQPSHSDFDALLFQAERHLEEGKLQIALTEFVMADWMDLFESPNFGALAGIAETKCRLGEYEAGLADLDALDCILEVADGQLSCFLGEPTSTAPGTDNPALSEACRDRMCGEIYLPYPGLKDEHLEGRLSELRARAQRVRSMCAGAPPHGAAASGADELPLAWRELNAHLESGAEHLRNGHAMAALEELVAADEMDLFEAPNYEALVGIAEAKCRLGAADAGLTDLAAFLCAVEVDAGKLPCYLNEDDPAGPLKGNPELNELCRERMCGEIYLPYYESKDAARAERLESLRARGAKVREICRTE